MPIYGYARVSTRGQTLASQDAQLRAAGCTKIYAEKVSGAQADVARSFNVSQATISRLAAPSPFEASVVAA